MASLQELVFEAIASADREKAEAVCRERRDAIVAAFPGWCKVPSELREDQEALRHYASCLIATTAENEDDDSLTSRGPQAGAIDQPALLRPTPRPAERTLRQRPQGRSRGAQRSWSLRRESS